MQFLPLNRKEDLGLDMNQLKEMVLERPWFDHQPTCSNKFGFSVIIWHLNFLKNGLQCTSRTPFEH
jgi:hypothetical protein